MVGGSWWGLYRSGRSERKGKCSCVHVRTELFPHGAIYPPEKNPFLQSSSRYR